MLLFTSEEKEPAPLWQRDDSTSPSCGTPQTRELDSASSPSDDWSDPRQCNNNASSNTVDDGVLIPSFLQPLLGLDFVPYLPPREVSSPARRQYLNSSDDVEDSLTEQGDNEEERENDLCTPNRSMIDTSVEVSLVVDDAVTPLSQRRKLSRKNLRSSIRKALRIKRHRHRGTDKGDKAVSPSLETSSHDSTPRRRGRKVIESSKNSASTTTSAGQYTNTFKTSSAEVIGAIRQEEERLARVQSESLQVQTQATLLANRVSSLQEEVSQLQRALKASLSRLDDETSNLEVTKTRLAGLEQETLRSAQNLERTIQSLLKDKRSNTLEDENEFGPLTTPLQQRQQPDHHLRRRSYSTDLPRAAVGSLRDASSSLTSHSGLSDDPVEDPIKRPRAHTEPRGYHRSLSSFMRVQDLELRHRIPSPAQSPPMNTAGTTKQDFFFIDQDVPLVLERLFELGYSVVTDESSRFEPTRDTTRLLHKHRNRTNDESIDDQWPVTPWHVATSNDVYVWTGGVPHTGFGHDWPVVKARTLVRSRPRALLDFLLDSRQVKTYNKMCQGREETLVLQEGVDTTADNSPYGIAGDVRILRTLNKPKLLNKTIEVLSMWYSRPLEQAPDGSFMIVNRSVWEDDSGRHKASDEERMLRSEMLLGVFLLRPVNEDSCELTTITHVFSPGVPERMAKHFAPGTAANMIRDIQAHFASVKS